MILSSGTCLFVVFVKRNIYVGSIVNLFLFLLVGFLFFFTPPYFL